MNKKNILTVLMFITILFCSIILYFTQNSTKKTSNDLYNAAEIGDVENTKFLIKDNYDVNYSCENNCKGWTPLMIASANGHKEIVSILLENGADPNIQNELGRTALQYAVRYEFIEIIQMLLDYKADPNLKDYTPDNNENVNSPMADALTHKQNTKILKMLILSGGNPNYSYWDFTPLIVAASFNDVLLVKLLLEKGANPFVSKSGISVENISNNEEIKSLIKKAQTNK